MTTGKRVVYGLSGIALIVAVCSAYLFALHRRYEKVLSRIRAAAEPVTLEELDAWYEYVPPAENPARLYIAAMEGYCKRDREAETLPFVGLDYEWEPGAPIPADTKRAIALHLAKATPTLDLIHRAARMPRCRYPIDLTEGICVDISFVARVRAGARLLALKTLYHADNKESAAALDAIEDGFGVARSLAQEPVRVSQLVRIASSYWTACTAVGELLSRVDLTDDECVRLEKILMGSYTPGTMSRALAGERCMLSVTFENPGTALSGGPDLSLRGALSSFKSSLYSLAGIKDMDKMVFLSCMASASEACRQPFPGALDDVERIERDVGNMPEWRTKLTKERLPHLVSASRTAAAELAVNRLARTAVGIERYRVAKGAFPSVLTDLVPVFIPEVFQDPFDGQPLRYRQTPDGYVVYSAGYDREDNDGRRKRRDGRNGIEGIDLVLCIVKNHVPKAEAPESGLAPILPARMLSSAP